MQRFHLPLSDDDRALANAAADLLSADNGDEPRQFILSDSQSETAIALPAGAIDALREIIEILAHGNGLAIESLPMQMRLSTAADILRIPREQVSQLVNDGKLPSQRVNGYRRVRMDDVLDYVGTLRKKREAALDWIVAESQALGLYD